MSQRNEANTTCRKEKSSHGGHGVHGLVDRLERPRLRYLLDFREAQPKNRINQLINA
jgi:hypothetical protein